MQNTASEKMAANMDSHTPSITMLLIIFWMEVFRTKLKFSAKADEIFCSDIAILKINDFKILI